MEITSDNSSGRTTPITVDPAADLAMLNRAKASVDLRQALDFGPWWYAPLLATMVSALTLFSQEFAGDWSFVYAAVGIGTGSVLGVHDFRRRKVRQRPSFRSAMVTMPITLGTFGVLAAWGTAVSTIGYERFVPTYAILGWLLTTTLLLIVRAVLLRVSMRRVPVV